jgi:hypothetical protein
MNLWVAWLLFLGGVAVGISIVNAFRDTRYAIAKEQFDETMITQGKEIARLRAQVALHIGKDKN